MVVWVILFIANQHLGICTPIFITIHLKNRLPARLLFIERVPFRTQKSCQSNSIMFSKLYKIMDIKLKIFKEQYKGNKARNQLKRKEIAIRRSLFTTNYPEYNI